jgi:MFS family permease
VLLLALWADNLTLLQFELLLVLIGAGFGPTPSVASVSVQNTVPRHQLGIALGTVNFSRQLVSTMMVALLGAIILSVTTALGPGTGGRFGAGVPPDAAEAAQAFRLMFFAVAGCLMISFTALVLMEERPLGSDNPEKT